MPNFILMKDILDKIAVATNSKLDGKKRILGIAILILTIAAMKTPQAQEYLSFLTDNTEMWMAVIGSGMGIWGSVHAWMKEKNKKVA